VIQFLSLTKNINKENIYCDLRGKIFNILNKFLQECLFLRPIITLITFSSIFKIVNLWIPPTYYSITQDWVKKGMVKHFHADSDIYSWSVLIT